jgi:hypothetical protein
MFNKHFYNFNKRFKNIFLKNLKIDAHQKKIILNIKNSNMIEKNTSTLYIFFS